MILRRALATLLLMSAVLAANAATFTIHLTSANSAPVAGAVTLEENGVTHHLIADSSGRASFDSPATSIHAVIIAPGFASIARELQSGDNEIVLSSERLSDVITVTASRTAARLGDTTASVVVLPRSTLTASAAATVDDTLRQIPGFTLFRRAGSRTANPTSQGVSLRGIGASGASRALVLDDGVPLNDPFGGWVYWGRVPIAALERVEVLRGGASDLYGSAAMGGVIQFIRRGPESNALTIDTSAGSEGTALVSLFTSGTAAGFRAALDAELFRTDGYVPVDETQRGAVDTASDSHHDTLGLLLERQLTESARLFVRASRYDERRNNGTPMQRNDTRVSQLTAGGETSLAGGSLSGRGWLNREHYFQTFSAIAANRASERLTVEQTVPSRSSGLTLQWSRALGQKQALLAGVEAREVSGSSDELQFAVTGVRTFVSSEGRQHTRAAFVQDTISLTSRLTLSASLRWDGWRNDNAARTTRAASGVTSVVPLASRRDDAYTPRVSALWRGGEWWSMTAAAYQAFRAPSLNELYRSFRVGNVLTQANESLGAERLDGYELGARIEGPDRTSLRGTLFSMTTKDTIANVTLATTPALITRQRQNLGRTRANGAELDGEWSPRARWVVSGGYLYSDATVRSFAASRNLEGLRVPQVPRHQATAQFRRDGDERATQLVNRLTISAQSRWSGQQFEDDLNQLPLRSYVVTDVSASCPLRARLRLTAAVENIFDRRYDIGATPVLTTSSGRAVRVGIRWN